MRIESIFFATYYIMYFNFYHTGTILFPEGVYRTNMMSGSTNRLTPTTTCHEVPSMDGLFTLKSPNRIDVNSCNLIKPIVCYFIYSI